MGLEKTLRELTGGLRELGDRAGELGLTLREDQPKKNGAAIVDRFEYAALDVEGWAAEALEFATAAEQAASHPVDIDRVRREVARCQDRFRQIDRVFSTSLSAWDLLKELTSFANERKGEWPSWAESVRQGIEQCRQPLEDSRNRLADSWQEISERVGMTSISLTTTNIGQRVASAANEQDKA